MFNERIEKYIPKNLDLISKLRKIEIPYDSCCLSSENTLPAIRETFKFIKEKETSPLVQPSNVTIITGIWITKDESNFMQTGEYTFATVTGIVKQVSSKYVVLSYANLQGESILTTITYNSIITLNHPAIENYFEEYVTKINHLPFLCPNNKNENYALLRRLSDTLLRTNTSTNLKFIINGVLSRDFQNSSIAILRNLIVLEEFFLIPVTSLSGFLLNPQCN